MHMIIVTGLYLGEGWTGLNFYGAGGRGPDMRAGSRGTDNPKTH